MVINIIINMENTYALDDQYNKIQITSVTQGIYVLAAIFVELMINNSE